MSKEQYYKVRNKLISDYESGKITNNEFLDAITLHASGFDPAWEDELSEEGKQLGVVFTKWYQDKQD